MKISEKVKTIFNIYSLAILVCLVLISVSIYIIFKPNKKKTPSGIEIVQIEMKDAKIVTEDRARQAAKEQFKILGEDNVQEEQLSVAKIQKNGKEYYYISSNKNTMEIEVQSGKVTKINSASTEV